MLFYYRENLESLAKGCIVLYDVGFDSRFDYSSSVANATQNAKNCRNAKWWEEYQFEINGCGKIAIEDFVQSIYVDKFYTSTEGSSEESSNEFCLKIELSEHFHDHRQLARLMQVCLVPVCEHFSNVNIKLVLYRRGSLIII